MNHFTGSEHNILSPVRFSNALRIEKLRSNRSKSPLSIALFSFQQCHGQKEHSIREFLSCLQRNTRETDIKGWVDEDVIGLILPDTDAQGLNRCVEKIKKENGYDNCAVITATYPNFLFERLIVARENPPDIFPIELDEWRRPKKFRLLIKRWMDMVGALSAILLLSPLMLLVALAIRIDSPGSAIFKQTRYGRKGVRFQFLKFRSMYLGCDERLHRDYVTDLIKGELEKINQGEKEEPLYKMKNDPRITRVGRIIRRTSIDELPQLFNVLKGDMSLVGPRPPLPYEVEKYEPWHLRRILEIKPGITGLWQVNGRSKTSFNDMVRMDLKYALNWSLWLDIKILLKTVGTVIRTNGAV